MEKKPINNHYYIKFHFDTAKWYWRIYWQEGEIYIDDLRLSSYEMKTKREQRIEIGNRKAVVEKKFESKPPH